MKIRKYQYAGNLPSLKYEIPNVTRQTPSLGINWQSFFETPKIKKPAESLAPIGTKLRKLQLSNLALGAGISTGLGELSDELTSSLSDSELGRNLGTLFSSGLNSAGNTVYNNTLKKTNLLEGMELNVGASVSGAAAGIAANYIGQGISSLGGDSMLSRGIGQGVATGLGTVGGNIASNLVLYGNLAGNLAKGTNLIGTVNSAGNAGKLFNLRSAAGQINPVGLAGSVVGAGLSAAFGPSKEYGGKYGSITKGMDTAYDAIQGAVGFIPGYGQAISGLMALNKGLSNIFGSTDGMTKQDAILGSAFMPAPVKWLNMAGASKTGNFNNLSWLNMEKTTSFMGNAFGNLGDKFNKAREEAGKTYGTFSHGAKNEAQRNINFANTAWNLILAMADLDELQRIRSQYMTSINNLRYAQMILGGWNPLAIGKQGMKIFNNATNHNMGMRLLSAAALIDNKQMILSALAGTKLYGAKKFRAMSEEELRNRKPEIVVSQTTPKTAEELNAEWERIHPNGGNADPNLSRVSDLTSETFNQTTKPPFTGQEYLEAAEAQRLKKIDKFHEAEKIGEAALMADMAVNAAPLLLRGFRWAFNKAGLLVKIPMLKTSYSVGLPGYPHYYNPTTNQWDFSSAASDVKQGIDNLREWMNNPVYRKAAEANKAEAEAMGFTYIPYYERPEYIRALENPNIKFKNLNSSVGGESNLSGEVTINTGTTLNPTLVVRHEMGHVAGLGKISESAAINPDNTLLLKELKYLRHKSNQVYKEGSEYAGQVDLNRNSFEGIQNARDFGEELGIKIGQEYPGYEKALEIVNSYPENGFKAGLKKMFRLDKEHMPYVWKALAGTLFTLATILYNTNK